MKIVCGSCGAKYSIADEKVQGKVFKIRCKKCSNVIMVKGTEGDEAVSDSSLSDGNASEWYVVIDGEQVGPITSVEIDSYYMSGRIDAETYVWRDGLSDWLPMSQVEAFAHLVQDAAGPDEKTQIAEGFGDSHQGGYDDEDDYDDGDATMNMAAPADLGAFGDAAFGGSQDDGMDDAGGFSDFGGGADSGAADVDPFADSGGGGMFDGFDSGGGGGAELQSSMPAGDSGGGGMFASFDSGDDGGDDFLGFSSGGGSAAEEPAPANGSNGSDNNMIGQRNENSVLFSLSSLDSMSGMGGGGSSSSSSSGGGLDLGGGGGGGGGEPEPGVTEGSGLIDIRALASTHKQMSGSGGGKDDDESVDPFAGGTMAMPALMPMGSHRSNKPLIIAGVAGGVLLLAVAVIAIVMVMNNSGEKEGKIVEKVIIKEKTIVEKAAADDSKEAEAAEKAAEAARKEAAAANDGEDSEKSGDAKAVASRKSTTRKSSGSTKSNDTKEEEPKEAAPAPSKPKGDNIDALLDTLDKKEGSSTSTKKTTTKTSTTSTSSSSGGKTALSKSDVMNTIRRYNGRISTCYRSANKNNLSGTMKVKFAIKPNGRTTNVSVVTGKFNGTDVGRCVQKAVQGMKFPSTSASSNLPVTYPFKLQ